MSTKQRNYVKPFLLLLDPAIEQLMLNSCRVLVIILLLLQLLACASDDPKKTPPKPEKPVYIGATNDGIDDVLVQRLPKTSETISLEEGTVLGAVAGTAGGALTGNPWLIPAGTAIGGLAGFGLAMFHSDAYSLQTDCFDSLSCSPWG